MALVQAYGWATMFSRYSEQMPLGDALAYTFNGQESCGYCAFVEETKENTWQADQLRLQQEIRLLPLGSTPVSVEFHPPVEALWISRTRPPQEHIDTPPGPPPRFA